MRTKGLTKYRCPVHGLVELKPVDTTFNVYCPECRKKRKSKVVITQKWKETLPGVFVRADQDE